MSAVLDAPMRRYDAVVRVRMGGNPKVISEVMVSSGFDRLHIEGLIEKAKTDAAFLKVRDFMKELYPSPRDYIITTEMRIV